MILSGARDDGAAGLASIAARGGTTVVQDPDDALYSGMPRAAIDHVTPDHLAPADQIGALLAGMTAMTLPERPPLPPDALLDAEIAMSDLGRVTTDQLSVDASGYGCPSCGGALFQLGSDDLPRYRCRIGHAWSPESLLDEHAIALEGALWMALRALEEKSALSRRMAATRPPRHRASGARFIEMAEDADAAGVTIRRLIEQIGATTPMVDASGPRDRRDEAPTEVG